MASLNSLFEKCQLLDIALSINPSVGWRALRIDGTIAPFPRSDHVRFDARDLRNGSDGKDVVLCHGSGNFLLAAKCVLTN